MPRELAIPRRRAVEDWDVFMKTINAVNGYVPVFSTLYAFPNYPEYNSAIVDKVAFDLDGLDKWDALLRFQYAMEQRGWEHWFIFSGGGYHCYVGIEPTTLRYPNSALKRFHQAVSEGLALGDDRSLHGDVSQCIRIPGTWNPKRGRFCIAIPPGLVARGAGAVADVAAKQRLFEAEEAVVPGIRPTLAAYDHPLEEYDDLDLPPVDVSEAAPIVIHDPFISQLLQPDMGHEARGRVIFWLVAEGYTVMEISGFLEETLSSEKYRHCVYHERQPQRIMEKYG